MNRQEAIQSFATDRSVYESNGAVFPNARMYIPEHWKHNFDLAMDEAGPDLLGMDAQPQLFTTPNSGIPVWLTTMIDPQVYEILFAPLKAAEILGEVKRGDWTLNSVMFATVEHTGEVSSYGDWNNNGSTGANTNFPSRQPYLFQTILQYGDREVEMAGAAKINWVSELNAAAAWTLNRFQNQTYFFGMGGLQNYGLLNDPNLPPALTPSPKAFGNNLWVTNQVITATPNEIYADIQSLVLQLITQSGGLISQDSEFVLALSPSSKFAITATNSFDVNVNDLLKDNIPNLKIIDAVQYGARSTTNTQGVVGGNFMQLICTKIRNQQTAFCAYNEKMRAHRLVPGLSSWAQKLTGGTLGTVIRQPFAISSMIGI
jgi:hypothetical protein